MPVHDQQAADVMVEEGRDHILDHRTERGHPQLDAAGIAAEELGIAEGQAGRGDGPRGLGGAQGDVFGQKVVAHRRMGALLLMAAKRQQDHRILDQTVAELRDRHVFQRMFHAGSSR